MRWLIFKVISFLAVLPNKANPATFNRFTLLISLFNPLIASVMFSIPSTIASSLNICNVPPIEDSAIEALFNAGLIAANATNCNIIPPPKNDNIPPPAIDAPNASTAPDNVYNPIPIFNKSRLFINALSYALYGQALSNIRKDNLVNKTNAKHMLVSLDFHINGTDYKIERGRKPNVLKFYVNNEQKSTEDEAQGDSRETQDAIERIIGMSHDMFKHVLALNTYTEPFLSLKANDQRTIIEQLLGITLLSERADRIKELNRQTKDAISQEEFRIRAVQEANRQYDAGIIPSMLVQEKFSRIYFKDVVDSIFAANDKGSALAIVEDYRRYFDTIIGTRGNTGKKMTNASANFTNLFDIVEQDPVQLEHAEEFTEAEESKLDELEEAVKNDAT